MNVAAPPDAAATSPAPGSIGEVFVAFLKLGVMSFGGPIAHLGYYREELVSAAAGWTKRPMRISSRSASFCRGRRQARSAFP